MIRSEHLRLAAAVAHVVPGADLHLTGALGDPVVVSSHPSAHLTPCHFRAILLASLTGPQADVVARIRDVDFGGSVEDVGGGVLRTRTVCGLEQRWIATTLPCQTVFSMIDEYRPPDLTDEAMVATVKPDPDLGVAVVAITVGEHRFQNVLDRVASDIAAGLMAEELVRSCTADDLLSTPKDTDS